MYLLLSIKTLQLWIMLFRVHHPWHRKSDNFTQTWDIDSGSNNMSQTDRDSPILTLLVRTKTSDRNSASNRDTISQTDKVLTSASTDTSLAQTSNSVSNRDTESQTDRDSPVLVSTLSYLWQRHKTPPISVATLGVRTQWWSDTCVPPAPTFHAV